jgi:hypothetical protein
MPVEVTGDTCIRQSKDLKLNGTKGKKYDPTPTAIARALILLFPQSIRRTTKQKSLRLSSIVILRVRANVNFRRVFQGDIVHRCCSCVSFEGKNLSAHQYATITHE